MKISRFFLFFFFFSNDTREQVTIYVHKSASTPDRESIKLGIT